MRPSFGAMKDVQGMINPLRGTPLVILRISRVHAQSQVRYDVIKYNPTF